MGLESIIIKQITNIAKNSGKLDATVDKLKSKVLDKGLELLEETGVDPSTIPVNIPKLLRGEITVDSSSLINPDTICSQPTISIQKRESSIRLINTIQEDVDEIYRTTNAIKEQLIRLQEPVNALNNSIGSVTGTVNSVSAIITTIKLLPFPVAVGGFGIPANVLTIYSSTLDNLDKLLSVAKANLRSLPKAIAIMAKSLNEIILKVNSLSLIIDPLLQFLQLTKSIIELQDNCPNVTQGSLDQIKDNLLSDITGSFDNEIIDTSNNLKELLQPNADPGYFYKNFKFTLEEDPNNPFFLPSRRIKCFRRNTAGFNDPKLDFNFDSGAGNVTIYNINEQTNPNFPPKSYSYSSDLQVLVNEAKFAVDVYTDGVTLWEAPQVRPFNITSTAFIDFNSLSVAEQIKISEQAGYSSIYEFVTSGFYADNINQLLPTYIIYGGIYVNLNNSPTDVAFGANKLINFGRPENIEWYERDFNQGGTIDVSSYVQSGTIQVNAPINIRMKTFGGTGNPIDEKPRFTEASLTIKRSFSIQDDVNPFTGKIIDSESVDDNIKSFESKYGEYTEGIKSIDILNTVYETFNDGVTINDDILIGELTQILENGGTVDSSQIQNLSNRQQLLFIETVLTEEIFQSNQMSRFIDQVYEKFYFLLPNKPTLVLSEKLYNSNIINSDLEDLFKIPKAKINKELKKLINDNQNNIVVNWWKLARYTQYSGFENRGSTIGSTTEKSIILTFLSLSSRQWIAEWNNIYGSRENYNNGAWVGGSSDIPIIPTQVGGENTDITIPIQVTQLAAVGETINEIIGGLELLGTYSYDLEIIDSTPIAGGEAFFYPTNYATFTVEDKNIPLSPNSVKQTNTEGY